MEVAVIFRPCTGECSEDGTHCEACGRSFEEVDEMRALVGTLVAYARRMEYENVADFADGVAASIKYAMGGGH
jgi:hypothetical protein